jgi:hypothetical protein
MNNVNKRIANARIVLNNYDNYKTHGGSSGIQGGCCNSVSQYSWELPSSQKKYDRQIDRAGRATKAFFAQAR